MSHRGAAVNRLHVATTAGHRPPGRARWTVNIIPAERAGRIVLGAAAVIAAAILLASAGSGVGVVLEILLGVAGLDLIVTGALGQCPLYQKVGYIPR
jgi:hypothetical protein